MVELSKIEVLVAGLAFTSRTETLEAYLKDRVELLTVIAMSSCYLEKNFSSCRVYKDGEMKSEFRLQNFRLKDNKWFRQPLIFIVFFVNWLSISLCLLRLKKRYDLYIGVSHSFALWGSLLKKMGVVKSLVYYCTDYYMPSRKINFNNFFLKLIIVADRFIVRHSDYVWHVSPRMAEGRKAYGGLDANSYRNIVVPLGYSADILRNKPLNEIDTETIGFVGTLDLLQGLQLLIEALPDIIKEIPEIKVKVIGKGPSEEQLKKLVYDTALDKYFQFLGFIESENEVLEILSGCAIGIAPYVMSKESHIGYADSGKPKLYAFCGLPTVVTRISILAQEMEQVQAGIAINYDKAELAKAVIRLLKDKNLLAQYKKNAVAFAKNYISDNIFENAFSRTLECLTR